MGSVVSVWAVRLTYNFARKGGYTWPPWEGEEDYRWAELRKHPVFAHPIPWFIFNLTFISFYQSFLICSFCFPIVLSVNAAYPLNGLDYVAAVLVVAFVALEYFADQEQWDFQQAKKRGVKTIGFLNTGLWARSRHPNFFGEQAVWVSFYIFSIAASGRVCNWTIVGCLLLMLLF